MIAEAHDGETVDALAWRVLGKTAGVTEQIFELNPGLADLGASLPGGLQVQLPEIAAIAQRTRQTVKLWD